MRFLQQFELVAETIPPKENKLLGRKSFQELSAELEKLRPGKTAHFSLEKPPLCQFSSPKTTSHNAVYLRELLEREFKNTRPILDAADGEASSNSRSNIARQLCILDIQMPGLSGVKAAKAIWKSFPTARVIFWTQFPHEIYINEIRKLVRTVEPHPAYGFIDKNNPESRSAALHRCRAGRRRGYD